MTRIQPLHNLNNFSGDGSTPLPVEYSPRETAFLITRGITMLPPPEVVLPPPGLRPLSSCTFSHDVTTAALPFNATDVISGAGISPTTILS